MTQQHHNRIAFITGGGRGFGKAFGHGLAAEGATVILADVDLAAAQTAAAEIIAAGGSAQGVFCDVSDEQQVAAVMAEVAKTQGGIDILINNAGLHSAAYSRPMTVMGLDKIKRLFDVNVMGVIICSLAAKPHMAGRSGAAIINISSSAAYSGGSAYGASKLAVLGLTMTIAREFAGDGIRVNGIAPGLIFTNTIRAELSAASVERVMKQQILPREGEEKDIVDAMLFLVSDKAAFITGETLRVTGGFALGV